MAIVFISPPKRQRILIFSIIGFFILILLIIGLNVYLTNPQPAQTQKYFTAPVPKINLDILKSDQLTNLEPIPQIQKSFQFSAKTAKGLTKTGIISAASEDDAMQALKNLSLTSIILNELKPGRATPFTPYYKIIPPPIINIPQTNASSSTSNINASNSSTPNNANK